MIEDCPQGKPQSTPSDGNSTLAGRLLHHAIHQPEWRLLRFVFFGALSAITYSGIIWLGVTKLSAPAVVMNVFAYLLILPLNFFFHRNYTFRRAEKFQRQGGRFLIVHAVYLVATSGIYLVMGAIHAPLLAGVVGALVMVPIIQFLALDRWVFRGVKA